MSNDRRVAGSILEKSRVTVTKQRGAQHGDVETSFAMIAELWSVWINHATYVRTGLQPTPPIHISATDVLQMMSMLKKARSVYGDPTMDDHYVDDVGYSSLAAMLQLPDERPAMDARNAVMDAVANNLNVADPADPIPAFLNPKEAN